MNRAESFQRFSSTSEARKDLRRSSVRAFTAVLSASGGEFLLRVGSTAILARLITPEHFGLFMMVTAVTAIADQFRDLGLSTATIQREKVTYNEVSNLFWINACVGVLLAVLVCALAPFVSNYFKEPRLTSMTMVLSANFIFGGLTVQHEALLTRQMKLGQKSMVRLLAFLLSSILAVVMAMWGFGYWALVWREVARSALIVVGAAWACPWLPDWPDRRTDVRSLVGFGRNLTLTYFLGILSSSVDRFLIGRFFGPGPVALYRQPYQLVVAPINQFMSPLYQVTLPGLSMLQDEPDRYRRFYHKVVSMVAMLSMPLSVFLAVYSWELTSLVLGKDWMGAAVFFQIFALGGILRSVSATVGFVLVSRGKSGALLKLGLANSLVMVALMSLGLIWGTAGVAIGEVTTVLVMFFPWMYYSFKGSPASIGQFLSTLARPATSSLLMGGTLLLFRFFCPMGSALTATVSGGLVAMSSLFLAWMLLPGGRHELGSLLNDILSATRRRRVSAVAG